jgi:peptidyl-tRNA hydrolase, PTH1 family
MKWIITGLGNSGNEYKYTRHNAGRIVLEEFRLAHGLNEWEEKNAWKALATSGEAFGESVLLLEPETMMNGSGKSLIPLVKSKKQAGQLVVIYDDLDLPLGTWKFSFNRGSGGHKGVESIARLLKTKAFVRVRIGVSPTSFFGGKLKKPKGEDAVVKFILGKFSDGEMKELKKVGKNMTEGLNLLLSEGLEKAMSACN